MKQQSVLIRSIICLATFAAVIPLSACSKAKSADASAIEAVEAGDYETGEQIASAAIEATGGDKLSFRAKGLALLGEAKYGESVDSFIRALSCSNGIVEPTDIDISYYLSVAQYKMGDLEEAKKTMDAVIGIRPKDDGAYFVRGKIDLAMGNLEDAINDFDNTVKLAPTNYDRYVGIYEELHARGYDEQAAAYLEKAISAGNKLSDYNKGVLEYYLGSYTDARGDLENAKKKGNNENLTLYLGKTYEALGDEGYAMSLYEEYVRTNSSAGRIYEQLATCKMRKEDYQGALETIETGLSLGNGEGVQGMMFDRAVAYERLYDFASAKKYMDEYLELFPDDEEARREMVFLSSR